MSGGEFVFDTQRPDNDDKVTRRTRCSGTRYDRRTGRLPGCHEGRSSRRRSRYLRRGFASTAIADQPYVTVVAAVAFGADDDSDNNDSEDSDSARSELQGIFLAQQRINTFGQMANNLRIRVLILNSGKTANDAKTAAQLVINEVDSGNPEHLIGIIGWPESTQTQIRTTRF